MTFICFDLNLFREDYYMEDNNISVDGSDISKFKILAIIYLLIASPRPLAFCS